LSDLVIQRIYCEEVKRGKGEEEYGEEEKERWGEEAQDSREVSFSFC
jgi:hypothetical protein